MTDRKSSPFQDAPVSKEIDLVSHNIKFILT